MDMWPPTAASLAAATTTSSGTSQHLAIFGSATQVAPLEGADVANASRLDRLFDDTPSAAFMQHTPPSHWCAVRQHSALHVTVIGVSVTAGCGAARGQRCLPHLGWARRLADAFHSLGGRRATWSLWPKNAAPLRFWLQCTTSSFELSPNTSLILVETEPTLTPLDDRELHQLVSALRRGAPNAVIGFVMWPSQRQFNLDRAAEQMVVRRAAADGFDAIRASTLLDAAPIRIGESPRALYGDPVHPNTDGHAMLAGLVCAWLLGNLGTTAPPCDSTHQGTAALVTPPPMPTAARATRRPSAPAPSPPRPGSSYERCYTQADAMPTQEPLAAGWRLRDEGRAKGVVKLGYVSSHPGDVLRLGPILPDVRCGVFDVSLGYLLSWRREQGALDVSCSGSCECEPMYQYRWQKERDHEPFPRLETWTRARGAAVDGALADASTTAYARFLLAKHDDGSSATADCTIHVAHARSEPSADGADSRVRIDGLSLKLSSCATHCVAVRHTRNRTRLNAVRGACADGASRGEPGFYAPSCAGCAEVV